MMSITTYRCGLEEVGEEDIYDYGLYLLDEISQELGREMPTPRRDWGKPTYSRPTQLQL